MKALLNVLAFLAIMFGVYGLVDLVERRTEDRLAYAQWVKNACLPHQADQTAIARLDGGKLSCHIIARSRPGEAPQLVSAAVMESPL